MNAANQHAQGTSTDTLSTPPSGEAYCLLSRDLLAFEIREALLRRRQHGAGKAYAHLLNHFHRAILPAFLDATSNNKTEAARLLGIHRKTFGDYLQKSGVTGEGKS